MFPILSATMTVPCTIASAIVVITSCCYLYCRWIMKANFSQCSFLAIYYIQFAHVLAVLHQVDWKFEGVTFIICVGVSLVPACTQYHHIDFKWILIQTDTLHCRFLQLIRLTFYLGVSQTILIACLSSLPVSDL